MNRLLRFLYLFAARYVGLVLVRVLFVGVPPRNYYYGDSGVSSTDETESLDDSRSDVTLVNQSFEYSVDCSQTSDDTSDESDVFVCRVSDIFQMAC